MIRLTKGVKPEILLQNEMSWNEEFVKYQNEGLGSSACSTRHRHPQIKAAASAESHAKCIYCEEKILSSQFGDVEHIKPKSKYPELYASWDNLSLACTKCNNAKSDREGILNPFEEDPSDFIRFGGPMIFYSSDNDTARLTVRGVDLNRFALIEKRARAILSLIDKMELMWATDEPMRSVLKDELERCIADDAEFSSALRAHYFETMDGS